MSLIRKKRLAAVAALAAVIATAGVVHAEYSATGSLIKTGAYSKPAKAEMKAHKSIVDVAMAAGSFDTLITAVKAAGLEETLRGEGPFTVFAPTDEAFSKIDAETLQTLLGDKEALTNILTYHVVPGKVMANDVINLETAKTVNGQALTIGTESGVTVNNANVVSTDILASNGVIHVIDNVMLPN